MSTPLGRPTLAAQGLAGWAPLAQLELPRHAGPRMPGAQNAAAQLLPAAALGLDGDWGAASSSSSQFTCSSFISFFASLGFCSLPCLVSSELARALST
jgi:hypothetical protein